jgi:hypothetical protein
MPKKKISVSTSGGKRKITIKSGKKTTTRTKPVRKAKKTNKKAKRKKTDYTWGTYKKIAADERGQLTGTRTNQAGSGGIDFGPDKNLTGSMMDYVPPAKKKKAVKKKAKKKGKK